MKTKQVAYSLAVFLFFTGITGCNSKWNGDAWVQNTNEARLAVLGAIPQAPYQKEQHEALKRYFESSETLLQLIHDEPDAKEALNDYLSKQDLNVVCEKTFLSVDAWKESMGHCQKNHFFLCAEAVRRYPVNVERLRNVLNVENQKRFDESAGCKAVLEGLNQTLSAF